MTVMSSACSAPVIAFAGSNVGDRVARPELGEVATPTNPFERLVRITQSNDRLVAELAGASQRLVHALDYRRDPDSNEALGAALVKHARRKRDRILDRLRTNRLEALGLLARVAAPH